MARAQMRLQGFDRLDLSPGLNLKNRQAGFQGIAVALGRHP